MSTAKSPPPPAPPVEVRYSLSELLVEVEIERATASFAMERLDQVEIAKLFNKPRRRRVLKSRK
jgi:hypothetical protein